MNPRSVRLVAFAVLSISLGACGGSVDTPAHPVNSPQPEPPTDPSAPEPQPDHARKVTAYAKVTGYDAVADARYYFGVPYVFGTPWPCNSYQIDCDCLVKTVYDWDLGIYLPFNPPVMWDYAKANGWFGWETWVGDILAWNEEGWGVSHIGLYAGNGYAIHASAWFGYTVESDMSYIYGWLGATAMVW